MELNFIKTELSKYTDNEYFIRQYVDLISISNLTEQYSEMHHILPRSLFPEYESEGWNIVRMTYDNHIEAHRLLAKITNVVEMRSAYFLMRGSKNRQLNIAKIPEVRKKISDAKLGVVREDMIGKKYFGASEETIKLIREKLSDDRKNKVPVKDSNGNKFIISVDDPRYTSGEFVSINRGEKRPNAAFKNPSIVEGVINKRKALYDSFKGASIDMLVDYLVEAYENGKCVFNPKRNKISKNYMCIVNKTGFNRDEVFEMVVQRLSKGSKS